MQIRPSKIKIILLIGFLIGIYCFQAAAQNLDWKKIATLPSKNLLGLGGQFSGFHGAAYLVVGGTNFPDSLPWQGGKKAWYGDIYVLLKKADGSFEWHPKTFYLPGGPRAYGVSISTNRGLLCIGGQNANTVFSDGAFVKWNPISEEVEFEPIPILPLPLSMMGGAMIGNTVYLVGGKTKLSTEKLSPNLWSLDLSSDANSWEVHKGWSGPGRLLPSVATQNNGTENCLYVFSGLNSSKDAPKDYLTDAFEYSPKKQTWRSRAEIPMYQEKARSLVAAPAIDFGAGHILIFSGVSGQVNKPLGALAKEIKALENEEGAAAVLASDSLRSLRRRIYQNHPGFPRQVLQFHTITNTWNILDSIPFAAPVGTTVHRWDEDIIFDNGEIYPGVRSNAVYRIKPVNMQEGLSVLNTLVLVLYFIGLIFLGIKFSKQQKTEADYFKGGGRIPWWAAALSLFGTGLSAITFMAVPAKTFATDWAYFLRSGAVILVPFLVNWLFIPFYRKLNITTAYQYLELRFNLATRLLASLSFLIFQLGRIGVVLFLPSVALNVVTGIDIYMCIIMMGSISLLYTMMGGIEAVIWTDVVQVIVLLGGGLLCLVLINLGVDNGFSGIVEIGTQDAKFNILNTAFDFTQPTIWVVIIGGFFSNLIVYSSDQTMVQRYLTTKDTLGAQKSLWTNILISVCSAALFFFIGTALYAFFKNNPQELIPGMQSADAVFPWYIISQLPDGVSGLLIAGIFAAAMSSLSSSMNSAATAYTIDFHQTFAWRGNNLQVGRRATLVFGIAGTLFALLLASTDVKSIWDEFLKIVGLITGGLGGVFMLGIISKRANGAGAIIGLLLSAIVQYWVASTQAVHLLLFTATGFIACLVLGYLASLFFPSANKPIYGLTIHN